MNFNVFNMKVSLALLGTVMCLSSTQLHAAAALEEDEGLSMACVMPSFREDYGYYGKVTFDGYALVTKDTTPREVLQFCSLDRPNTGRAYDLAPRADYRQPDLTFERFEDLDAPLLGRVPVGSEFKLQPRAEPREFEAPTVAFVETQINKFFRRFCADLASGAYVCQQSESGYDPTLSELPQLRAREHLNYHIEFRPSGVGSQKLNFITSEVERFGDEVIPGLPVARSKLEILGRVRPVVLNLLRLQKVNADLFREGKIALGRDVFAAEMQAVGGANGIRDALPGMAMAIGIEEEEAALIAARARVTLDELGGDDYLERIGGDFTQTADGQALNAVRRESLTPLQAIFKGLSTLEYLYKYLHQDAEGTPRQ